jgi:hypothetical protein
MTEKIRAAASSSPTLGAVSDGPDAAGAPGHPDSCRICPHPPQPLELPPVSQTDVPRGFPEPGCRILVMPRAGSGWPEARIRSGVNMPGMRDSRAGFAATDPGVLAAAAQGPARGHGQPDPIAAPGRLAVTPAAQAAAPLTTPQHHHDGRAAPVVTVRHRQNPGRPGQQAVTGSRAGPGRGGARALREHCGRDGPPPAGSSSGETAIRPASSIGPNLHGRW